MAEMSYLPGAKEQWELVGQFVDVIMGGLARHTGEIIANDPDLPVLRFSIPT